MLLACKTPQATPAAEPDGAPLTLNDTKEVDAAPRVLAARCKAAAARAARATVGSDVEVGDAVAIKDGFAVGVLRHTDGGVVGSVVTLSRDLSSVTWADLGAPYGDAPPPRPAMNGGDLYAAFYGAERASQAPRFAAATKEATRKLSLFKIDGDKAQLAVDVAQQKDESLAYDYAFGPSGGVVVWDEDAIGLMRGDIQIALLSPDVHAVVSTRIVSGELTDAELPRVVARKGGFFAVWVANKLETPDAQVEGLEGPGEARAFHWLEAMLLDEHGAPKPPSRRLTPANGHVSTFDLAARDGGETLDVLARDDDQASDGTGGRILRVSMTEGKVDSPLAIVSEAVGRGMPDLVTGPSSWLAYADVADHLRLIPLDDARAPLDAPSVEDGLEHARPLLSLDADTLVAAFQDDGVATVAEVPCAR